MCTGPYARTTTMTRNLRNALTHSRLSPQTRRLYQGAIDRYVNFARGRRLLDDGLATKYISSRLAAGLTPSTVDVDIAALTCAFRKCGHTFPVAMMAKGHGPRTLTPSEMKAVLALGGAAPAEDRDLAIVHLMLRSGYQAADVAAFRVERPQPDLRVMIPALERWWHYMEIGVTKRGPLFRALQTYGQIEPRTVIGAPLGVKAIDRIVKECGRRVGIPLTSRVLYQTYLAETRLLR